MEEKDLPFKIKNKKRPRVLRVSKGHPVYEEMKGHAAAIQRGGTIYIIKKNVPHWVVEHEVAHYQLGHKEGGLTLNGYFRQEVEANLLCYSRIGQPKNLDEIMNFWWDDTRSDIAKEHPEMSKQEVDEAVCDAITSQLQYYWQYLPIQWRADYSDFLKEHKSVALSVMRIREGLSSNQRPARKKQKKATKKRGSTPALKGVR